MASGLPLRSPTAHAALAHDVLVDPLALADFRRALGGLSARLVRLAGVLEVGSELTNELVLYAHHRAAVTPVCHEDGEAVILLGREVEGTILHELVARADGTAHPCLLIGPQHVNQS